MLKYRTRTTRHSRLGQVPGVLVITGQPAELDAFEKSLETLEDFKASLAGTSLTASPPAPLPVIYSFDREKNSWAPLSLHQPENTPLPEEDLNLSFQGHRQSQNLTSRRYLVDPALDAGEVELSFRHLLKKFPQFGSLDVYLDGIFKANQYVGGDSPTLREPPRKMPGENDRSFAAQECFSRLGFDNSLNQAGNGVTVVVLDTSPEVEFLCPETVNFWMDLRGKGDFPAPLPVEKLPEALEPPTLNCLPEFKPQAPNRSAQGSLEKALIQPYHGAIVARLIRQMVPEASIILMRVLNDHGEGAGSSLTMALEMVHFLQFRKINAGGKRLIGDKLVINLSFGLFRTQAERVEAPYMLAICDRLCREGAVIVAASGNNSYHNHPENPQEPAAYGYFSDTAATDRNLIPVAATAQPGSYAWFSNQSNLGAPGHDLILDFGPGTKGIEPRFIKWSGTSFATPLVTGSVAALLAQPGGPAPGKVKELLWKTATPPDNWKGIFEINLGRALASLKTP